MKQIKLKANKTLDESLTSLLHKCDAPTLDLQAIIESLSENTRLILLIFLSLLFCTPLQIPGLSTPLGIIIMIIGFRLSTDKPLWIPQFIAKKKVPGKTLKKVVARSLKIVKKLKFFLHPRMSFFCSHPVMKVINGFIIIFFGLLLALPLPIPLSNIVFAWPILIISLGLLEKDGLFVCISYFLCLVCLGLFFFLGYWFHGFSYFKTQKITWTSSP